MVLDIHMPKNDARPLPNSNANINSKWIKNLKGSTKIIKLLFKNTGEIFHYHYTGFANDFLDMKTKAQAITTKKRDELYFIKITSCT